MSAGSARSHPPPPKPTHHVGPDVLVKLIVLAARQEAVGAPGGGVLVQVVHRLQVADDPRPRGQAVPAQLVLLVVVVGGGAGAAGGWVDEGGGATYEGVAGGQRGCVLCGVARN